MKRPPIFDSPEARFTAVGSTCAALQLCCLIALSRLPITAFAANALALILVAQINFILSHHYTWRNRRPGSSLARRWLLFAGNLCLTGSMNVAIFSVSQHVLGDVAAAIAGMGSAAVLNFVISDRHVFTLRQTSHAVTKPLHGLGETFLD